MGSPEVPGSCPRRFELVRDALADQLGSAEELGASIFVNSGREPVVDIRGTVRACR
ncbi:MAG: hypothetical protein M3Z25_24410 [Actinomycetota bacterium]|nr:hypothetical protein [Actinomycetota bacterium]